MRHFSELRAWRQNGLGGSFVRGKMEFEETLKAVQHTGVVLIRDSPGVQKALLQFTGDLLRGLRGSLMTRAPNTRFLKRKGSSEPAQVVLYMPQLCLCHL